MERKDLLKSPDFWISQIQMELYACASKYMERTGKNRKELAEHLGVSKSYVSQLLNGDYDHKLSKLVELSIAFGYIPKIEFRPLDEVIYEDSANLRISWNKEPIECNFSSKENKLSEKVSLGSFYSMQTGKEVA